MKTVQKVRWMVKLVFYAISSYFVIPFFVRLTTGVYNNFFSSSISFNLDTLYLNWNTTFPAVTVCEIYNGEKIWDTSEEHFGAKHNLLLDDLVGEIVFFRGTCTTCEKCEHLECPLNFTELLQVFRAKCSQLIDNCRYTNKKFNCCDEFLPIHTEYGVCFSFNSNQARKIAVVQRVNNRATGPGFLMFDAIADIQVHVHPPIEIPFFFSEGSIRETVLLGTVKEIIVNVMEVYNDVSVDPLTPEQRRCRRSTELTPESRSLGIYDFYSYSTCVVECTLGIQLLHCNCTNHLLADAVKYGAESLMCDYKGLMCLTEHYNEIKTKRKSCDCQSSCDEPEYNIVYNSGDDNNRDSPENTHIGVSLMELPTQRYIRRVTKNNLDLMISVGGLGGLFFNASLIRVLEMIYMLLEFKWSSLLGIWRF